MDDAGIYARYSPYLECHVQVGLAGEKVISVSFPEEVDPDVGSEHPLFDRFERYLEGDADDFADVDVGLTVPSPHRSVLEATRQLPYGEDASVEQLARMTPDLDPSNDEDLATVRQALADNPVPILIPDHRVRDGPSALPPTVEQRLRALEDL